MDSNIPEVLEGKLVNEKVVWFFSDIDSLSPTYKGFRKRSFIKT